MSNSCDRQALHYAWSLALALYSVIAYQQIPSKPPMGRSATTVATHGDGVWSIVCEQRPVCVDEVWMLPLGRRGTRGLLSSDGDRWLARDGVN